jgi:hypothetical protein
MGVVMQAVQDVGCLARRGGDDLGADRAVLAGVVGVEDRPGVDAVFRVHVATAAGAAARPKILAVG